MSEISIIDEDNALLQRVALGDEKAFRFIFNKYHNRLGAHLFSITKSHELAQEVVQDIFLKIWVNRQQLTEVRNFKAYLYVMSKNHALNCLKQNVLEKTLTTGLEENEDFQAEESTEENDHYMLIDEAIDHLPPQQRQVYLMSRHERLKYTEIATRLSLSRETVKKYLKIASESITSYIRKKLIISVLLFILFLF
jgi:RNA polymerase sigma-70 factor (ECF subfamily)